MSEKTYRSFKIIFNDDKPYGRYLGDSPYQAANKAFSELIKKNNQTGGSNLKREIKFKLIETTKGSKHKEHEYIGKRIKLDEPIKYITKNGNEIIKKYKNDIKKLKKDYK